MSASVSSWISAFGPSSSPTTRDELPNIGTLRIDAKTNQNPQHDGRISEFVFLVAGLEKLLSIRDDAPVLIDTAGTSFTKRVPIASGASFSVEGAEWSSNNTTMSEVQERWGKSVALKYVRRSATSKDASHWKHILLEIRALLHEPIRYHPNIVRLLGLSWGAAKGLRSNFPMLVLEFSELGTLAQLQKVEDLPFNVKKKLCYDVSKGISILHACGIVHGDLKHENILIFPSRNPNAEVAYIAKLADFGGSVMDLEDQGSSLHMGTPPYEAPEAYHGKLDGDGMKRTDVYSLGLLVWRVILNGGNPFSAVHHGLGEMSEGEIMGLKKSNELRKRAKESLWKHTHIGQTGLELMDYVLENTLQEDPNKRRLNHAIAALQAAQFSEIQVLLKTADDANKEYDLEGATVAPGHKGVVSPDDIGLLAASYGLNDGYYDFQKTGPGYRPFISAPDPVEFLFEPERLRTVLDWDAQQAIIHDLEVAATAPPDQHPTQISNAIASFYLFKCYCHEFGVKFDAEQACYWLRQAALTEEDCQESYLAQAWCWRVHRALGVELEVDMETLRSWMCCSIVRGHIKCIPEAGKITQSLSNVRERRVWEDEIENHTTYLRLFGAGIGMPYFMPDKLRREYPLRDLPALDHAIQEEFSFRNITHVNEIYVNHLGHGLLHYAASLANLKALRHLVDKYSANVDLPNEHAYETPLLCACRSGHLSIALYLLDRGASPDGSEHALEVPLYWLCAFEEAEIPRIASRLVSAGAKLTNDEKSRGTRRTKNNFTVDYEDLFCLPVSPLSRAVMMESLPAVRALLALGADPLEQIDQCSSVCPIVLASVLMLPDILEVLLVYIDARTKKPTRIFNELEMLRIAMDMQATMQDPTALLNRITRCDADAKVAMDRTLRMLHDRDRRLRDYGEKPKPPGDPSSVNNIIVRLVALGRADIIRSLLELGHRLAPCIPYPAAAAAVANNETIFRLFTEFEMEIPKMIDVGNGNVYTLLHYTATRHSYSRSGMYIAEYLLKKLQLPVDPPLDSGLQPPFAMAVKNQYFDLADLLLQHGADIDQPYIRSNAEIWIPVFGDLVFSSITEKTVESIRWLLNLDEQGRPLEGTERSRSRGHILPAFVVNEEGCDVDRKYSILHFAAQYRARTDMEKQALGRVVRLILSVEQYHSQIDYFSLAFGTPLMLATLLCNLEVVAELLEGGATTTIGLHDFTPEATVRNMLGYYPHMPEHLKAVYGEDVITHESIWKRMSLIAELFEFHSSS
ncbi:hypothetical protein Moror_1197 [Moniliophthora roreri MCA 2997]|uniref:Protein kinase domain-containing protein n=1 Tax=Moniliophthora roreri (strain MCA 2997) TaxID=1381753 RepID=V2X6Z9_MONRO|nr:hypothetical protein Moror_1197 [Moniliophthora roreri MCA 2997]